MKPYYEKDGITIYHGDCREIGRSVRHDIIVTDPPYGIGKAEWDEAAFDLSWASVFCPLTVAIMPGVWNIARCPEQICALPYRWTLSVHLVNGMTRGAIGFGNWIPCLVYSSSSLYKKTSDVARVVVGCEDKPDHPSPKPFRAMLWILSVLPDDGVICDPFAGSGTTLLAARKLGRKAIGIEIEERYCEIAAKRLAQGVLI